MTLTKLTICFAGNTLTHGAIDRDEQNTPDLAMVQQLTVGVAELCSISIDYFCYTCPARYFCFTSTMSLRKLSLMSCWIICASMGSVLSN